jgi:N-methylhydantoinase A
VSTSEQGRHWLLGVDVGGTFTDLVLADGAGEIHTGKVPTTPHDPIVGVVDGVVGLLADAGVDAGAVTRFVHGTTLATNVILQRSGGPVALVTTEGFADLLRLGRDARVEEDRYDLRFTPATPPVDPRLTFEVRERVDAAGTPIVELTQAAVDDVVALVVAAAPVGVAICLLHSYARPAHEQAVADALRTALPDAHVVCSSDVWPEMREYERAMTTVVSALVGPVMSAYLSALGTQLGRLGIRCPIQVLDSAGDVMSAARAAALPVSTVESGGAAGVIAAGIVGQAVGAGDVISFDMGGTTAKAGIVRGGRPAVAHDFQVGGKGSFGGARAGTGIPVKIPVVDLAEVGAGGGSIAGVDNGILRVGPRSAGADPGPACYGRGGTEPTVTDADLVLGYLDPAGLAGGVSISVALARAAIDTAIARPLGIDTVDAARAVHDIVNANMAAAIRVVTVQRGIDPREFALVGFGGAGPMHVSRIADEFGIATVVVPWGAGVASAIGLVSADLGAEHRQPFASDLDAVDAAQLARAFAVLEQRARAETGEGDGECVVSRFVGMRVRGQVHALEVPVPDGPLDRAIGELAARFTEQYLAAYGVPPAAKLQLTSARVRTVRAARKHAPAAATVETAVAPPTPADERLAHFPERGGFVPTPVFDWTHLEPGARLPGPAIVEGPNTTVVVLPDRAASVDRWRNVVLSR